MSPDKLAETRVPPGDNLAETLVERKKPKSEPGDVTRAERARSGGSGSGDKSAGSSDADAKKKITQLGDFKLVKKLGQGGMGTVYLAKQVSLDRDVALKTLSKEFAKKPDFVQRFIREARSMAKLHHPNIVQVYAADSSHGIHYAAIEFIDGRSMQDWMNEKNRLSVGDALHVTLVCAAALKQAHDQNMIHRDIKPDNILVTRKGVVKVADFGLAKAIDDDVSMTQSGTGLGTPLYMAPEQARNAKHVDKRSDIYALGSTLYYFLTGALPFSGETTLELIIAKEKGQFKSVRKLNSEVPERLDFMIDKMMAKDPQHRYADCAQIISDLQSLNLASDALSFIEGAQPAFLSGSVVPSRASLAKLPPKPAADQRVTSAQDAERTATKMKLPAQSSEEWIVRYTVGRKMTVGKMTAAQVTAALNGGTLDSKTKIKRNAKDQFVAITDVPQFADVAGKRAYHDQEAARSRDVQNLYSKLDKKEQRRKVWRKFSRFFSGVKGLVGLVLWLALVAAVVIGGIYFAWPYLRPFFKST
ncbi:MAG: serine/threonine-protein kinase [Planctomycetaceae bacterium]